MSPIFARKTLRQSLGRDLLRDTLVGNTSGSCGAAGSGYVIDRSQANAAFSGEDLYSRAYLLVNSMDLRVATFNVASGAWVSWVTLSANVPSGGEYEVHELISPADKSRAIDWVLHETPVRQEVPVAAVANQKHYSWPSGVRKVLDAWYYADPDSSLDRLKGRFSWWGNAATASGREVRIEPALLGSYQIILDAITTLTLGALDAATVNLESDRWLLYGAEAQCWEMASKRAPGEEASTYRGNARRAAAKYRQLTSRWAPQGDSKLKFDDPI